MSPALSWSQLAAPAGHRAPAGASRSGEEDEYKPERGTRVTRCDKDHIVPVIERKHPVHTYQRAPDAEDGTPRWQAGIPATGPTSEQTCARSGPVFEKEEEAAAFASYINGGRWSPRRARRRAAAAGQGGLRPRPRSRPREASAAEKAQPARRAWTTRPRPTKPDATQVSSRPMPPHRKPGCARTPKRNR